MQVEAEHGMAYGKPLTRVRETVEVIRQLLQEGRVSYQGETVRIQSFDLWFTPRHSTISIYASAVVDHLLRIIGRRRLAAAPEQLPRKQAPLPLAAWSSSRQSPVLE